MVDPRKKKDEVMHPSNLRLQQAREAAGFKSAMSAAKHFHWSHSTYASHENGQTSPVPRRAAERYAKAFKVRADWILAIDTIPADAMAEAQTNFQSPALPLPPPNSDKIILDQKNRNDGMADGTKVDLGQLNPEQTRRLDALVEGRAAEVWRLTSDVLLGAHYRPGQLLIVEIDPRAEDNEIVLAYSNGVPIFRLYLYPYLFSLRLTGNEPAIMVDNVRTVIKGAVRFPI